MTLPSLQCLLADPCADDVIGMPFIGTVIDFDQPVDGMDRAKGGYIVANQHRRLLSTLKGRSQARIEDKAPGIEMFGKCYRLRAA